MSNSALAGSYLSLRLLARRTRTCLNIGMTSSQTYSFYQEQRIWPQSWFMIAKTL